MLTLETTTGYTKEQLDALTDEQLIEYINENQQQKVAYEAAQLEREQRVLSIVSHDETSSAPILMSSRTLSMTPTREHEAYVRQYGKLPMNACVRYEFSVTLRNKKTRKETTTPFSCSNYGCRRKVETLDFLGFANDKRKWNAPEVTSVLYSLILDIDLASGTHVEFCENLGIDVDSRRGLESYLACQKIGEELAQVLGHDMLSRLRILLSNY